MKTLKLGSFGSRVKRWQFFLIGQGFEPGIADADFGPRTHGATVAFQEAHGLVGDGIVGNRTLGVAMQLGFEIVRDPEDHSQTGPNWPPRPEFKSLSGTRNRQRVFGRYEFVHEPVAGNFENIRILGDWEAENIVTVEVAQLRGLRGAPSSGRVRFHRLAAPQLLALWQAWEDAGLLDRVLSWHGSYVPRFIRGDTRSLSNHAFGSAFDVNFDANQLGVRPALVGEEGSVRELVPLANELGFYWGGHFRSRPDGMHFEIAFVRPPEPEEPEEPAEPTDPAEPDGD